MARHIEEPVTKKVDSPVSDSVTTHPAFGQIGVSRVSGSTALYDSDFRHNAYMVVTIRRSELHRGLHRDRHFGKEELIQVAMSEAQWATFVSSPNVGFGAPCTIQRLGMEPVPGLPTPKDRAGQFAQEVREQLQGDIRELDRAIEEIESLGLSKTKTEQAKSTLVRARRRLFDSLPFIASQFDEHMEETVEKAKAEVHGYMTGVLTRAGLDALTNGQAPLQIEDRSEGED